MIQQTKIPIDVRHPRRRRWWLAVLLLALLGTSGFLASRRHGTPAAAPTPAPVPSPLAASPSVSPTKEPSVTTTPPEVPARGSGKFQYVPGRSSVLGTKGPLRRFRVAVEKGSGEDPGAFAQQVVATLGDQRSWTGGGTLRLQRVAGGEAADFTVFLATRDTAARMCDRGGVDIRVGGVPYTSCRTTGRAIVNLDRWRGSAKPFRAAGASLDVYRQYLVNHEVGHELGHHHQDCPRAGGPAPVMVQQTLTTRGCVPYPWPRRGNGFFSGPAR